MKTTLALLTLILLPHIMTGVEKHALIVGISSYNQESKWPDINARQDIKLISDALISRGFKRGNITSVEKDVTKTRVFSAFDKLISKVQPGDVAVFHFSGHGYQIPDDNGDELDGLDEALVMADAPHDSDRIMPDEFYKNYLRDDELGQKLDELRQKLGPGGNVLVITDACHSGTSTRGIGIARGTVRSSLPTGKEFKKADNADFGFSKTTKELATMVCIFGSSQDQLNYEYHVPELKCGSLSFAFSKAIAETDSKVSYRALFERIRSNMISIAPRQTPHAEGDFDQEILGGQLLDKPVYYRVAKWSDGNVVIDAGTLMSCNIGSKVKFFPPDTRDIDSASPLAEGEVVSTNTVQSVVNITTGSLNEISAKSSWAYLTERTFGDMAITVCLKGFDDKQKEQWKMYLEEYPFVTFTNALPADLLLERQKQDNKDLISLTTKDDLTALRKPLAILTSGEIEATQIEEIIQKICVYTRAAFLRSVEVQSKDLNVTLKVIPYHAKSKGKFIYDAYPADSTVFSTDMTGMISLTEKMHMRVRLTNHSNYVVYYSLLDVMPNDALYLMLPAEKDSNTTERKPAYEYKLQPRETIEVSEYFTIGPPYGIDMFKLIVSREPLPNLGSILLHGASFSTRGNESPFEKLLSYTYKSGVNARNVPPPALDNNNVSITNFVYRIVPKN